MTTSVLVKIRDGRWLFGAPDARAFLYLPDGGHPDGPHGLLRRLALGLEAPAAPEAYSLPLFEAEELAERVAGRLKAQHVVNGRAPRPLGWRYTVKPANNRVQAVYVEVRAPLAAPGSAPGAVWVPVAGFLVWPWHLKAPRRASGNSDRPSSPAPLPAAAMLTDGARRDALARAWTESPPALGEVRHHDLPVAADTLRRVARLPDAVKRPVLAGHMLERANMADRRHEAGTAPGGPNARKRRISR